MEKVRKTVYIDIDNITEIERIINSNFFYKRNVISKIVNDALRHYFYYSK